MHNINLDSHPQKYSMFTAKELAKMELTGFPKTERAWLNLVKRETWSYREVLGMGRGGMHRVYSPPPEIMTLILAKQPTANPPLIKELSSFIKTPLTPDAKLGAVEIRPSLEWMIQAAILAAEAPWLTEVGKETKSHLILRTFNLLLFFCNADDAKFAKLSSSPDAVLSALRLVYEIYSLDNDCPVNC